MILEGFLTICGTTPTVLVEHTLYQVILAFVTYLVCYFGRCQHSAQVSGFLGSAGCSEHLRLTLSDNTRANMLTPRRVLTSTLVTSFQHLFLFYFIITSPPSVCVFNEINSVQCAEASNWGFKCIYTSEQQVAHSSRYIQHAKSLFNQIQVILLR